MRARRSSRSGFTLVELLMAIAVIGILMALLLPAINGARRRANVARVRMEIAQLEQAIFAFKAKFGVEPPSKLALHTTQAGWDGDPVSKGLIKRIWPQFDFSMPPGSYPSSGTYAWTEPQGINSGECLLFFLGGIINDQNAPIGFSANPAYPFSPSGTNRIGPFIEFDTGRIKNTDKTGLPEYVDPLSGQTAPYLYFSSYEGKGYNRSELPAGGTMQDVYRTSASIVTPPGTATAGLAAQKAQSFQIISPGVDSEFGLGGVYNQNLPNAGLADPRDYDNITNFSGGELNR